MLQTKDLAYIIVGLLVGGIPILGFSFMQLALIQSNVDNTQSQLDEAKSELRDSKTDNSNLRNQVSELNLKLENLRDEILVRNNEIASRNQLLVNLNGTLIQLKADRVVFEGELSKIRTDFQRLDAEKVELEKQKAVQVSGLSAQITKFQQNITALQADKINLQRQIITLQEQIVNLNSIIASLREQLNQKAEFTEVRTYDFDKDDLGKIPANWTGITGSWSIIPDTSAPSRPNSYKQIIRTSDVSYLTIENGSYDFTKGMQITWMMKTLNAAGSGWASFGLVVLYRDNDNYYKITRDDNGGDNNYLHIYRVVNGMDADLVRIPIGGTTSGSWRGYSINALATGSQITIQYDLDGRVGTISDKNTWTTGRIGLRTSSVSPSTADAVFDNLVISYRSKTAG